MKGVSVGLMFSSQKLLEEWYCARNSIYLGYFSSLYSYVTLTLSLTGWVKASYWPAWPLISPDPAPPAATAYQTPGRNNTSTPHQSGSLWAALNRFFPCMEATLIKTRRKARNAPSSVLEWTSLLKTTDPEISGSGQCTCGKRAHQKFWTFLSLTSPFYHSSHSQ